MATTRTPVPLYDPQVALEFFQAAGTQTEVAQGQKIFAERQRSSGLFQQRDPMYLLLSGEVSIVAGSETIGSVKPGEIFGELAPLTQSTRSATAVASTACTLIGLNQRQFLAGVEKRPEFALMLMGSIIARLRETIARLKAAGKISADKGGKDTAVLERKLLKDLARELGDEPPLRFRRGDMIVKEGGAGAFMYAVLEGRVVAGIDGTIIEHIGPGGVLGEVALVDQAPRAASAAAETDCALLAINRRDFLALVRAKPAFSASLLRALAERLRFLIAGRG